MREWTKSPSHPVRIGIVLFDQFSNLCLANCIEPMRAANMQGSGTVFDWRIITVDGGAARSSSGLDVLASATLSQNLELDYLLVMASYAHETHDTPTNRGLLRAASRQAKVTIGLDAGPWLLAAAGLLDGRRATVHWDLLDAFTERFLDVEASRARVVRDGPMMTCAGAMSALDLTLDLISDHLGLAMRLDVEALFLHGDPPGGQDSGEGAADPLVRKALSYMRDNVERPLSLSAMAKALSCQQRTLDRHFRHLLGAPPGKVYRHIRLSAARKLIEDSRLPMSEVALRCGYESAAAMTRAIRELYGAAPSALRRARQDI